VQRIRWLYVAWWAVAAAGMAAEPKVLFEQLQHVRSGGDREWDEFPHTPEANRLELKFPSEANQSEWTLQLRQRDVKQAWGVILNDQRVGALERDENDMVVYLPLAPGTVRHGENTLRVEQEGRGTLTPDDIRVGEIVLHPTERQQVLQAATLEIDVSDAATGRHLPARITVVNEQFSLQTVGAASNEHLAVRAGTVYTADGKARFGLPAGTYTVYAGRGFEYSLAEESITLSAGEHARRTLSLRREVPTEGYVACDTHVHTLTHSGHGDATVQERMITLAAEGIELPIATDHNAHVDHEPFARAMKVREYLTPVIGNEVTTPSGHFNIFPVSAGAAVPDHRQREWKDTLDGIFRTPGVKVAILNHARDLHSGVRPFGPERFNAAVGEHLDGWAMRFIAMEVINSSATQNDILRLPRDWMALLNRGRAVTPVGSSDSHDVARHFVGQGRTYIRCDDRDPGALDVESAVNNFLQGRVNVSYGLLAELTVNGKYGPGELAPVPDDQIEVSVRVLGPSWVSATTLLLFRNGQEVAATAFGQVLDDPAPGVLATCRWTEPRPKHDVHLVAIALGPGTPEYWKTAKPYQATSTRWEPHTMGVSGAVWLDVDGDGRKTSAYDYAVAEFVRCGNDLSKLVTALAEYDRAVAAQAAHLYQSAGHSLVSDDAQHVIQASAESVRLGFRDYLEAWRANQLARAGQ